MKAQDVILGIVMKKPMSGYDIKKCFETTFSFFFDASYGSVYPTLDKMEREGYLSKETVPQAGKPNKNVFSITDRGREAFRTYLNSAVEPDTVRSDICTKLYFGEHTTQDQVLNWMRQSIDRLKESLASLRQTEAHFQDLFSDTQRICVQIGIQTSEAQLSVLQESYKQLLRIKGGEEVGGES